jgi:hypothetical protein
VPPANVCPNTFVGKVYTAEMSASDIQLISSVCNENQTFLVEYTPFDNLTIAKRVLEQCFEGKRKKNSHLLVGVRGLEFGITCTHYISYVVHQLKGNTWKKSVYLMSQPTEAYEWYTKTFKCPPPLGRTAFNEWVKIYKCFASIDPAVLGLVRSMSQEHLGKSLTKVNGHSSDIAYNVLQSHFSFLQTFFFFKSD